jgi:hypothetical protein
MTGFIRGFFSKPQLIDEAKTATPAPAERPKQSVRPEESTAFFLDASEAQTMGNVEYMKASKKIRRTFPKTLDSPEHKEYVQELSAMERKIEGKAEILAEIKAESQPAAESETPSRRSLGSDMNMFLNMAKDIRK